MKWLSNAFKRDQRRIILSAATAALTLGVLVALIGTSVASANGVPFAKGDVLVAVGPGTVKHFDSGGNLLDTLDTTTANTVSGMCFDAAGNLYAADWGANTMSKFDSSGNLLVASFGSGFNTAPESCVFDTAGNMYVGQSDTHMEVLKLNTSGTWLASFSPQTGPRGTDWVDLARDQCTLYYTSEGTEIKAFNVCTNTQLPAVATGLDGPNGECYQHRVLADGSQLVACVSEVEHLSSQGAIIQTYTLGGSGSQYFDLVLAPDGTSFWASEVWPPGQIWKLDIALGGVLNTFYAGVGGWHVHGLAVVGELTGEGQSPEPVTQTLVSEE